MSSSNAKNLISTPTGGQPHCGFKGCQRAKDDDIHKVADVAPKEAAA